MPAERMGKFEKEDLIVEAFRSKLREAYYNDAAGEMTFRLSFANGGVRPQAKIGMKIEYEFVQDIKALDKK